MIRAESEALRQTRSQQNRFRELLGVQLDTTRPSPGSAGILPAFSGAIRVRRQDAGAPRVVVSKCARFWARGLTFRARVRGSYWASAYRPGSLTSVAAFPASELKGKRRTSNFDL